MSLTPQKSQKIPKNPRNSKNEKSTAPAPKLASKFRVEAILNLAAEDAASYARRNGRVSFDSRSSAEKVRLTDESREPNASALKRRLVTWRLSEFRGKRRSMRPMKKRQFRRCVSSAEEELDGLPWFDMFRVPMHEMIRKRERGGQTLGTRSTSANIIRVFSELSVEFQQIPKFVAERASLCWNSSKIII